MTGRGASEDIAGLHQNWCLANISISQENNFFSEYLSPSWMCILSYLSSIYLFILSKFNKLFLLVNFIYYIFLGLEKYLNQQIPATCALPVPQ